MSVDLDAKRQIAPHFRSSNKRDPKRARREEEGQQEAAAAPEKGQEEGSQLIHYLADIELLQGTDAAKATVKNVDDPSATVAPTLLPGINAKINNRKKNEDRRLQNCEGTRTEEDEASYAWARDFLEDLTQIMTVSAPEMHRLMVEHCGANVRVPPETLINKWMTKKYAGREDNGNINNDDNNNNNNINSETNVAEKSEEGSVHSSTHKGDGEVQDCSKRDSYMCAPAALTTKATAKKAPARKHKKKDKRMFDWARKYLAKLIDEGQIHLPKKKIHSLMLQNCGDEPVPSHKTLEAWLSTKRMELGNNSREEHVRARICFEQLVAEGRMVTSTCKQIHTHIQQVCGTSGEPVPSFGCVRSWLQAERKGLGPQQPQAQPPNFEWARVYFNNLMHEGHTHLSPLQIHCLMQTCCGSHPLPPVTWIQSWLLRA